MPTHKPIEELQYGVRVKYMDPDFRNVAKKRPCARCGKTIKDGSPAVWVRIVGDGWWVMHRDDHAANPTDDLVELGPSCARMFGRDYIVGPA